MPSSPLPRLEAPEQGYYRGHLRLMFAKAMDELASEEVSEFINANLSLYGRIPFVDRFARLRYSLKALKSLQIADADWLMPARRYVAAALRWSRRFALNFDWYLEVLHTRLGLLVTGERNFQRQLRELESAHPVHAFLQDYPSLRLNLDWLRLRSTLLSAISKRPIRSSDEGLADDASAIYKSLKTKSADDLDRLEERIKRHAKREIQQRYETVQDAAREMSYMYTFALPQNRLSPELRPWQPYEESREDYREYFKAFLDKGLPEYLDHIENELIRGGARKTKKPRERDGLNQRLRMEIFVLHRIKGLTQSECLDRIECLLTSRGTPRKITIEPNSVSHIVEKIGHDLGLESKKSASRTP